MEAAEEYLKPGAKVLDVGSGSGYLTAAMALMVQPGGKVIGVEHLPALTRLGHDNVAKNHANLLETIEFVCGDGREGWPAEAPFQVIHVGAAAGQHIPKPLLEQLAPGGLMIIPVGTLFQTIMLVRKSENGTITQEETLDVRYVPLVDPNTN